MARATRGAFVTSLCTAQHRPMGGVFTSFPRPSPRGEGGPLSGPRGPGRPHCRTLHPGWLNAGVAWRLVRASTTPLVPSDSRASGLRQCPRSLALCQSRTLVDPLFRLRLCCPTALASMKRASPNGRTVRAWLLGCLEPGRISDNRGVEICHRIARGMGRSHEVRGSGRASRAPRPVGGVCTARGSHRCSPRSEAEGLTRPPRW